MNKPVELREADFKKAVFGHDQFKKEMLQEFFDYWTEPTKSGIKMRFEIEKTWHLGRRLSRWANNGFGKPENKIIVKRDIPSQEPVTDIDRLDSFMARYATNLSSVKFEAFASWYDLMKENKLLKQFTVGEVEDLKTIYNGDKIKCRSACVQQTMNGFVTSGLKFKDIINMRQKLNGR